MEKFNSTDPVETVVQYNELQMVSLGWAKYYETGTDAVIMMQWRKGTRMANISVMIGGNGTDIIVMQTNL